METLVLLKDKCRMQLMVLRHLEQAHGTLPTDVFHKQLAEIKCSIQSRCTEMFSGQYVYVLELAGGNFYVGFSESVMERIACHFGGSGSIWTQMHQPVRVVEVEAGGRAREREKTLEYMRIHGWERVRGAGWCRAEMLAPPQELVGEDVAVR